jgi:hypothetical protein
MNGFDELRGDFERLARNAEQLQGSHSVLIFDLLTPAFMSANTRFASFEAMLAASPFTVESTEEFERISDNEWDAYVCANTTFTTWQEMLDEAVKQKIERDLLC